MDLAVWVTVATLVVASVAWTWVVRRIARSRSLALQRSLQGLNASLDREIETLTHLESSLAQWTTTMEAAARALQERGNRPSPAPAQDPAGLSWTHHDIDQDLDNFSQDYQEVAISESERYATALMKLMRATARRHSDPQSFRVEHSIARNLLVHHGSYKLEEAIVQYLRFPTSWASQPIVSLREAVQAYTAIDDDALGSVIYASDPKSIHVHARWAGGPRVYMDWVMATKWNVEPVGAGKTRLDVVAQAIRLEKAAHRRLDDVDVVRGLNAVHLQ